MNPRDLIPPHSISGEACVLGSMMLDVEAVDTAYMMLEATDFFRPSHQTIFNAICTLRTASQPVELVTVKDQLVKIGQFDAIGGINYIVSLAEGVPSTANIEYYSKIVLDYSKKRRVIRLASELTKLAYMENESASDLIEEMQKMAFSLDGQDMGRCRNLTDGMKAHIQMARDSREADFSGYSFGFPQLDALTGGMQMGNLVILGARPKVGKSAMAKHIAMAHCKAGGAVIMFSAEMNYIEIGGRVCQDLGQYEGMKLRRAKALPQYEFDKVVNAAEWAVGEASEWNWKIEDKACSLQSVAAITRRMISEWKTQPLVIIDYLQIQKLPDGENDRERLSTYTRGLKGVATDLNVPIILLSQIRRPKDGEGRRPPPITGGKGTSSIEEDANTILIMHHPEGEADSDRWMMVKGRGFTENSWCGHDQLRFAYDEPTTRFSERGFYDQGGQNELQM